ncbi:MAG: NfeD family protein [Verrucomicrobiota bacterium]
MRCLVFLGLTLLLSLPASLRAGEAPTVCVITIHEEISRNTIFLIRRGLNEAAEKNATAVILNMDTNGGSLAATEDIIKLLGHASVPTYTYVDTKAFSAGAIIASATDKIFMAPGSVIGAATPIMVIPGQGIQEMPAAEREKMNSATRALVRSTAQQKGHNGEVFEAMVDKDRGLIVGGVSVCETGKLLTLTSGEAAKEYGQPPKALLSAGTHATLDGVLKQLDLANATLVTIQPYGFELAARLITSIAPLLIVAGLVGIYLEIKTPGFGVPGFTAIACFALLFAGYFVAGLAGWEQPALFVAGLLLLGFEVLFPGHLVSGIVGLVFIIAALLLAMAEKWPGSSPWLPTWANLQWPLIKVLLSFTGSTVVMAILAKYLPQSSFFQRMELATTTSNAHGYTTAKTEAAAVVGATGLAATQLRPSGMGQFGENVVDVVTEGDLIEKGASIRITEVQGSRVVVTRAK